MNETQRGQLGYRATELSKAHYEITLINLGETPKEGLQDARLQVAEAEKELIRFVQSLDETRAEKEQASPRAGLRRCELTSNGLAGYFHCWVPDTRGDVYALIEIESGHMMMPSARAIRFTDCEAGDIASLIKAAKRLDAALQAQYHGHHGLPVDLLDSAKALSEALAPFKDITGEA